MVSLTGFLDSHTVDQLEQTFQGCFANGCHKVIVDMARLDYISSAGFGILLRNVGLAAKSGGNVVVLKPCESVREVLEVMGGSRVFVMTNSIDQALETAAQPYKRPAGK